MIKETSYYVSVWMEVGWLVSHRVKEHIHIYMQYLIQSIHLATEGRGSAATWRERGRETRRLTT